jgi:hypothetical protein
MPVMASLSGPAAPPPLADAPFDLVCTDPILLLPPPPLVSSFISTTTTSSPTGSPPSLSVLWFLFSSTGPRYVRYGLKREVQFRGVCLMHQ